MKNKIVPQEFIGKRFGKLEVIGFVGVEKKPTGKKQLRNSVYKMLCRCDCGREKEMNLENLRGFHSSSCGFCPRIKENSRSKHPLFRYWANKLCTGALCDEWHNSFDTFVSDVGEPPKPDMFLIRKNTQRPFSKDNFYWSDGKNRTFLTGLLTAAELARRTNLTRQRIEQIKDTTLSSYSELHPNGHIFFKEEAVQFINNREKGKRPSQYMKNYDDVKIDSDIPMPPQKRGIIDSLPFGDMKVGDSFFVKISAGTLYVYKNKWARKNDSHWKFTIRPENDGSRCWRTE